MIRIHNTGFPRIGQDRQLKKILEAYWQGEIDQCQLQQEAQVLRHDNWQLQSGYDFLSVGDFSLYDTILDTSFMFGVVPERIKNRTNNKLDAYFLAARGQPGARRPDIQVDACDMTKWLDTNYHYIVPELDPDSEFHLDSDSLLQQIEEAQQHGKPVKPIIVGPVTFLWLSKFDAPDPENGKVALLDKLLPRYASLLSQLADKGIEWVQMDEPILATDLLPVWQSALRQSYHYLNRSPVKILLAAGYGPLGENEALAFELPTAGLHLEALSTRGNWSQRLTQYSQQMGEEKVLSLGVVDGRNIWRADLNACLEWLAPLAELLTHRLWLAPSCSLMHIPLDVRKETHLPTQLQQWLAFAIQKQEELFLLKQALNKGKETIAKELQANRELLAQRYNADLVVRQKVRDRVSQITLSMTERSAPFSLRQPRQKETLSLPLFPTTTIGSFPQTPDLRKIRHQWKVGQISEQEYRACINESIRQTIETQEAIGLDVLVHGEPERNDMVEYFGELLEGVCTTRFGWVQSYGSRCVKPPIIYGDVERHQSLTGDWIGYAQSLTTKPVKGMLTGPVTLLNWSFVRDDLPREAVCRQLALAIRDEVLDLERQGIKIIQIDEAALREKLPLKKANQTHYLDWAIQCFKLSAAGVKDETQIHTHMCYSSFNEILEAIAEMDADVITIENARSNMALLKKFCEFRYPNEIGPGVYDIHSPNVPTSDIIARRIQQALDYIEVDKLWINPDCGLKTRGWPEVIAALKNMVEAAKKLRSRIHPQLAIQNKATEDLLNT